MTQLVNQPMEVVFWYPTAIVKCNCTENVLTLVVVTGMMNLSTCGNCRKMYRISRVDPSPVGPKVIIELILPTDLSKMM